MNDNEDKNIIQKSFSIIRLGGLFWPSLFAMLIACMHYGYSCNTCGCGIVDSEVGGR